MQIPQPRSLGTQVLARKSWHDGRPSGAYLLRPNPFGDVSLHSAAECFIARMRVCDLRVRIVRDGHEPNEAEEQRPCRVPIEPVHVTTSPKDRRELKGYQNSAFAHTAVVATHGHALPDAWRRAPDGFNHREYRRSGTLPWRKITVRLLRAVRGRDRRARCPVSRAGRQTS